MSVPVSTGIEVLGHPTEYKSGEMNEMSGDNAKERKVAFITGTTGQDGSYLVELLLAKGASRRPTRIPPPPSHVYARVGMSGVLVQGRSRSKHKLSKNKKMEMSSQDVISSV